GSQCHQKRRYIQDNGSGEVSLPIDLRGVTYLECVGSKDLEREYRNRPDKCLRKAITAIVRWRQYPHQEQHRHELGQVAKQLETCPPEKRSICHALERDRLITQ